MKIGKMCRKVKKALVLCIKKPSRMGKAFRVLRREGLSGVIERAYGAAANDEYEVLTASQGPKYEDWYEHHRASEEELAIQKETIFPYQPKFSILVPAYQTPEIFLRQLLDSLRAQTYDNWELCLADASENETDVKPVVAEYQAEDPRIKYQLLAENRSISENTNEALTMAEGDFIGLLDHDDLLAPNALYEIVRLLNEDPRLEAVYTDEDKISFEGEHHFTPHFKPDFNLDLLRTNNYICHFFVVKKSIADQVGGFRKEFNGSQDYDFIFRCSEKAEKVGHIAKILYHWRTHENSTSEHPESKMYCYDAAKRAIEAHLERMGETAVVDYTQHLGLYRVTYPVKGEPLVSIIIPNKDAVSTLRKCLNSIREKSTYANYEIIIVENNSTEKETGDYYRELEREKNIRVVRWPGAFNYSAINNFGVKAANGEYLLLLNNDMEVITPNWLELLLGSCQRKEIGVVGCKLLYPDHTIQHAGVVVGICGVAGHIFAGQRRDSMGYFAKPRLQQDLSAVTAACMMVKRSVYEELQGLDEQLQVAYNDIDFCLRVRELGYLVMYEPNVEMYHDESRTRGKENTPEKKARFAREVAFMEARWGELLAAGDPYYNPNLTRENGNYTLNDG